MRIGVVLFVLLLGPSCLLGAVIHVPSDQPNIQAALAVAAECDTIMLASGTYTGAENHGFVVSLHCLTIMSESGAEATVLELEGDNFIGPDLTDWEALANIHVLGLTFHEGDTAVTCGAGAGVIVSHCVFEENTVGFYAYLFWNGGNIDSCVFRDNGRGLLLREESYFDVTHNVFVGNNCAIDVSHGGNMNIVSNVIARSIFAGIWSNTGWGPNTCSHNVIYANGYGIREYSSTNNQFMCNDVYDNFYNYVNSPDFTGIDGNFSSDPRFCDPTLANGTGVASNSLLLPQWNECGELIGDVALGCSCCSGHTGDANNSGDDSPTLGDVSALIQAIFINGSCDGVIACLDEADVNQSGGMYPTCADLTLGDVSLLIEALFVKACDPDPCYNDLPLCLW